MELTKAYFDQQIKTLATKDDLLDLATSNDITAVKADLKEIRTELKTLNKRDIEDSDAFAKDILNLRHRLKLLETKVKQLAS